MSRAEDYRFVLLDTVERVREEAAAVAGATPFEEGRQMAYFEILEHIRSRAELVGLSAAEVGMAGFDPGALVGLAEDRAA